MRVPARRGRRGNCYATCEAIFHMLGGKARGWIPHTVRHEGDVHWYLVKRHWYPTPSGARHFDQILDPTAAQFKTAPPYERGRGRGFLTKVPSRRARELIETMLYQEQDGRPARSKRKRRTT